MPRLRSPVRDKAFEIWRDSHGEKLLKDIADELGVTPSQIRKWKNQDGWDERLNSNVTNPKRNVTKKAGAPKDNKNAAGHRSSVPVGNTNAVTHGFFRRIFPDDEETHAILEEIAVKKPVDILWENIVIQYTAIARAQRIMFVQNADDHSDFQIKTSSNSMGYSEEHERQWAWTKQSNFMQAQSRAMSELRSLIKDFITVADESDIRRLRIEQMTKEIELKNAEIAKLTGGGEEQEDDGFLDALHAEAGEVWNDDGDSADDADTTEES